MKKKIKITVTDEELQDIALKIAEEMGIEWSDELDSFDQEPVFPSLNKENKT